MDLSYLAKPMGECHGDEHLMNEMLHSRECLGDPDIWCTCMEDLEQERERMAELHFDSLRDDGEI